MKIRKANKKDSKEISKLMLKDLKSPDKRFPKSMIKSLRIHAQKENILKEFSNSKLIGFVALIDDRFKGFIVGYKESNNHAMIHYVTSKSNEVKKGLLKKFITFCKRDGMKYIITDVFEFFENYKLFLNNNFKLFKKEKITNKLPMLWLRLNIK
ncbi:hypothetical protein GOV13_02910 [Candidatus Pacearchaeota archaeon]|nr:hypothetical protein [Candidatus Pacearchaeota archaeon]